MEMGGRKNAQVRGMGDTRIIWTTESAKQSSYWLTENGAASRGLAWFYTRSSPYILFVLAWWFVGTCIFHSFACFLNSFPHIGFLAQLQCEGFSYCTWFSCIWLLSLGCLLLSIEKQKGSAFEGNGRWGWLEWREWNCGRDIFYERRIYF